MIAVTFQPFWVEALHRLQHCRAFGLQPIMRVEHQSAADWRCVITMVELCGGFFRIVPVIIVLAFAR